MRSICVVGGKGGVGKTTTAISLSHAMSRHKKVLLVDANLTTPDVHVKLGWPILKNSLLHVLEGKMNYRQALFTHECGLKVLPAITSMRELSRIRHERLKHLMHELHADNEVVMVDSAAGLGPETVSAVEACNEVLVVTNPDLSSVIHAQKCLQLSQELGKAILGAVVTKVRGEREELSIKEIESLLDVPVLAAIPHDKRVRQAAISKSPVTHSHPKSSAARAYTELAGKLLGPKYVESVDKESQDFFKRTLAKIGL